MIESLQLSESFQSFNFHFFPFRYHYQKHNHASIKRTWNSTHRTNWDMIDGLRQLVDFILCWTTNSARGNVVCFQSRLSANLCVWKQNIWLSLFFSSPLFISESTHIKNWRLWHIATHISLIWWFISRTGCAAQRKRKAHKQDEHEKTQNNPDGATCLKLRNIPTYGESGRKVRVKSQHKNIIFSTFVDYMLHVFLALCTGETTTRRKTITEKNRERKEKASSVWAQESKTENTKRRKFFSVILSFSSAVVQPSSTPPQRLYYILLWNIPHL